MNSKKTVIESFKMISKHKVNMVYLKPFFELRNNMIYDHFKKGKYFLERIQSFKMLKIEKLEKIFFS